MNQAQRVALAWCLLPVALSASTYAQQRGTEVRGIPSTVRKPVNGAEWVEREETVYREQYVTEMRDTYRTVYSPVTQYHMEPRWHNWWNPFGRPYIAYHMRPRTRWETRHEQYQTPVTRREYVPETRIVRTKTLTPGFVERQVVERVVVGSPPAGATIARSVPPGNVIVTDPPRLSSRMMASDPPRRGTSLQNYRR